MTGRKFEDVVPEVFKMYSDGTPAEYPLSAPSLIGLDSEAASK